MHHMGWYNLNLNPNIPDQSDCKRIFDALISGEIKLKFEGLFGI